MGRGWDSGNTGQKPTSWEKPWKGERFQCMLWMKRQQRTGAVWDWRVALCSGLSLHPLPTKSQLAAKLRIKRQDHRAWWWFGTLSSPLLKGGKEMGMRYPGLWARHAGSPSRQALGDGWEESWSFPQSFSLQGTGRLAAEWGEKRALGRGAAGKGLRAHSNMQSPAAP